ncbi:MAG: DUF4384 domain-containing protein, partial [Verrucomicrobiota bacterium]
MTSRQDHCLPTSILLVTMMVACFSGCSRRESMPDHRTEPPPSSPSSTNWQPAPQDKDSLGPITSPSAAPIPPHSGETSVPRPSYPSSPFGETMPPSPPPTDTISPPPPAPESSSPIQSSTSPDAPFTLALNKEVYEQGDLMHIEVEVKQSGYLYIAALWADGGVYLLYPNFLQPRNGENLVNAGETLTLPGDIPEIDGKALQYPMYFPPQVPGQEAKEAIFAFLTTAPLLDLPEVEVESGLGPAFRSMGQLRNPEVF